MVSEIGLVDSLQNLSIFSATKGKIEACDVFLHSVPASFSSGYLLTSVQKHVKQGINHCLVNQVQELWSLEQSSTKLRLHLGTGAVIFGEPVHALKQ